MPRPAITACLIVSLEPSSMPGCACAHAQCRRGNSRTASACRSPVSRNRNASPASALAFEAARRREPMAGRRDDDIGVRADRRLLDRRDRPAAGRRARCRPPARATGHRLVAIADAGICSSSLGCSATKAAISRGAKYLAVDTTADRQPAAAPGAQILHRLQQFAHRALDRLDMRERRLAGGVELQAGRRAREQRDADRLFKALHARRQRRRRHVERVRRADQRAGLGDGEQRLQLREGDLAGARVRRRWLSSGAFNSF